MRPADLVVDLDLAVRRGRAVAREHARHVLTGSTVHIVTTRGSEVDVCVVDAREWGSALADACRVSVADAGPRPPSSAPGLPWELVVSSGAARVSHRDELAAEVLGRAAPAHRSRIEQLHLTTVGRLRAVGTAPGRRRIGWVSWVLLGDGWAALTPYVAHAEGVPRTMVRLEPRDPTDLVHDVARWTAGAVR